MAVTATGAQGVRLAWFKTALSNSGTFQSLVEVDEKDVPATSALAFIALYSDEDSLSIDPGYAVLSASQQGGDSVATHNSSQWTQCTVRLTLVAEVPADYRDDIEEAGNWADNTFDAIRRELLAYGDTTQTGIYIRSYNTSDLQRVPPAERRVEGDYVLQHIDFDC